MKFRTEFLKDLWCSSGGSPGEVGLLESRARQALESHQQHGVCQEQYKYSKQGMKSLAASRFYRPDPRTEEVVLVTNKDGDSSPVAPKDIPESIWSQIIAEEHCSRDKYDVRVVFLDGQLVYVDHGVHQELDQLAPVKIELLHQCCAAQAALADFKTVIASSGAAEDVFEHLSESLLDQAVAIEVGAEFQGVLWLDYLYTQMYTQLDTQPPVHLSSHQNLERYLAPYLWLQVASRASCKIHENIYSVDASVDAASAGQPTGGQWIHARMYLHLQEQAQVEYTKVICPHRRDHYMGFDKVLLADGACLNQITVGCGSELLRGDQMVMLVGAGSAVNLSGLSLVNDHFDQRVCVVHGGRSTVSQLKFKSLAYGQGQGAFDGKIDILQGAVDADARLMSRNLLLDSTARIVAIPELLCSCDEVKASHGATVSELSSEDLWYLTSRGIEKSVAYEMLVAGFMADTFQSRPELKHHSLCQIIMIRVALYFRQLQQQGR